MSSKEIIDNYALNAIAKVLYSQFDCPCNYTDIDEYCFENMPDMCKTNNCFSCNADGYKCWADYLRKKLEDN